jgi:hypothetical protein
METITVDVPFDQKNGNWNTYDDVNRIFLRSIQNHANHVLNTRGVLFLNEVYDLLGSDRTALGGVVGWLREDPWPVSFAVVREDDDGGLLVRIEDAHFVLGSLS